MSRITARNRWALLLVLLLVACGEPVDAPVPVPDIVIGEEGSRLDALPHPAARYPPGSRLVRLDLEPPLVLTEGMAAAGGATPSLDGKEILFTGKEDEGEPYGLWACGLDGSGRRRLVVESEDCGRGTWLPDGGLVYARALGVPGPIEGMDSAWALFRRAPEDVRGKRITFGAGCDVDPHVLDDGRILYGSWQPTGGMATWTVHPDGTGAARTTARLCEVRSIRVAARSPRPQGHLSTLRKGYTSGTLLCLDARPPGRPHTARVRIKALRGPHVDGRAPESQVLGEVPLSEDGSFFVSVPSDTPLLLDVLDARGKLLDEGITPFWVRPNETRACIGCHEKPDTAPPNVRPAAVAHDPFTLLAPTWGSGR